MIAARGRLEPSEPLLNVGRLEQVAHLAKDTGGSGGVPPIQLASIRPAVLAA